MGAYGSPELHPKFEKDGTYKSEGMFIYCSQCGTQYSRKLPRCPFCGASNWYTLDPDGDDTARPWYAPRAKRNSDIIYGVVIAIIFLIITLFSSETIQGLCILGSWAAAIVAALMALTKREYKLYLKRAAYFAVLPFVISAAFGIIQNSGVISATNTQQSQQQTEQRSWVQYSDDASLPFEQYASMCQKISYNSALTNPTKYIGEKAYFSGYVVFSSYSGNKATICISVDSDVLYMKYYRYNTNEPELQKGTYLTAYGEMNGLQTYTSIYGREVTVPLMNMVYWTTNK